MAVPNNLAKVTMHGRLGGSEIALFGFHIRLATSSEPTEAQRQEVADKIGETWLDAFGTAKDLFCGAYQLEYVRLDWLDPEPGPHHLKTDVVTTSSFATSGTNSFIGTGASLPWECAIVVSMAAYPPGGFAPNKGRHRGRFYLPGVPASVITGTEAQMPDTAVQAYSERAAAWLEAINDVVSDDFDTQMRVVILSRVDDAAYDVQHIWVDSKIDSQRRRENRQPALFRRTETLDA